MNDTPAIRPAAKIAGSSIDLRNVAVDDAEFMVNLRRTEGKSTHISATSPHVPDQVRYIESYHASQGSAYFIICNKMAERLGTVRLYDAEGDSFSWGSWLLAENAPQRAGIESALIVYAFGIDFLGFSGAHFGVRQANTSVWRFHERFGARRIREDGTEVHYSIDAGTIRVSMERYRRYLPHGIEVVW